MFIIVYRPHGALHCETVYYGPFEEFADAYDHACTLPAVGVYIADDHELKNEGVKFVQELTCVA